MPAPRGPLEHEVRGAFAAKLGVDANADADTFSAAFDKRMHEERLHGAIAQKLGLDPFQTSGADILTTVDERLDARAKAVGLPAGAKVADIEAAETAARRATPPTPAASGIGLEQTLAEIRDRLPRPPTDEERQEAEDEAAIARLLRSAGADSSNGRVPGEDSDPNSNPAWR